MSSLARAVGGGTVTGDLKNNVLRLLREIRRMKLQVELNTHQWCAGTPSSFLPILHAALMEYSLPLAQWLVSRGCSLYGKSDRRFLEGVYRVLRDIFDYYPKLTREQFLAVGYAERKVMLTCDFLLLCQAKHTELTAASKKTGKSKHLQQVSRSSYRERESSPPEVLTVREGHGVGSAWSEKVSVLAESEPSENGPLVSHHSHTLPTQDKPPQENYTLPIQAALQNSKVTGHFPTVRYLSLPPTPVAADPPVDPPESPVHESSPSPKPYLSPVLRIVSPSSSKLQYNANKTSGEEGAGQRGEEGGEEDDTESWRSLPLAQTEPVGQATENPQLQVLSDRVGELTKLVEEMAARFALVETQLMLASPQEEGQGVKQGAREDRASNEKENVESCMEKQDYNLPLTSTHLEGLHWKRTCLERGRHPLAVTNSNEMDGKAHLSPAGHCPRFSPQDRCSSSQDSRWEHALIMPTGHTPSNWRSTLQAPSPSAGETQQLIEKLQSRAQKTKQFLQQATSQALS